MSVLRHASSELMDRFGAADRTCRRRPQLSAGTVNSHILRHYRAGAAL